ncbi:hypothetical protein ACLOJK_019575, partial [Asimina triloba]
MPGSGTLIRQEQQLEDLVEMDLEDVHAIFRVECASVKSLFASCDKMEVMLVMGVVIKVVLGEVEVEVRVMEVWDVKKFLSGEVLGIKGHRIKRVVMVAEWVEMKVVVEWVMFVEEVEVWIGVQNLDHSDEVRLVQVVEVLWLEVEMWLSYV